MMYSRMCHEKGVERMGQGRGNQLLMPHLASLYVVDHVTGVAFHGDVVTRQEPVDLHFTADVPHERVLQVVKQRQLQQTTCT